MAAPPPMSAFLKHAVRFENAAFPGPDGETPAPAFESREIGPSYLRPQRFRFA
jgi:hypothetical protein